MMNLSSLSKAAVLSVCGAGIAALTPVLHLLAPSLEWVWGFAVPVAAVVSLCGSLWYIRATDRVLREAADICDRSSKGDLEARIARAVEGGGLGVLQNSINALLDVADAFVRESGASLDYVSKGKYFRKILVRGLPGAYRHSAMTTNKAVDSMAKKVSSFGKFTTDLVDETGGMIAKITGAVSGMLANAETLATGAKQTSEQSVGASAASEEVSVNVQTVSAAAEELSKSIMEIGRQVTDSTKVAETAVHEAERTNTTVKGLVDAVNRIGEVISLINDIASQTNLLALNATIEAARAGEAGKGFSVVASEVKALANQTAKATEDITGQIGAIQAATNEAVTAIQTVGKTIGRINEFSSAIASAVEEQNAATSEIARNVQQAAAGTQEVSRNISSISTIVAQVTDGAGKARQSANEVGQVSEGITKRTAMIREEIGKFLAGCA